MWLARPWLAHVDDSSYQRKMIGNAIAVAALPVALIALAAAQRL